MKTPTFQTIQQNTANTSRPIPLKPASGYYVSTTASGNAATTEIIRTEEERRSA